MHKLFGGGKAKVQTATNLQIQKTKQIESLRKVRGLTSQFPQEKPVVSIFPPVTHPWVDPQTLRVTGCPALNNFSMHSDLGQVIQTILEEFKKNPPTIISSYPVQQGSGTSSSYGVGATPGYPPPPYIHPGIDLFPSGPPPVPPRHPTASATTPQSDSDKVVQDLDGFRDFAMPNIIKAFPQLKDKKLFELQELMENDEQLLEMLQGLPELINFAEKREELSERCVLLARTNLSDKPKIEEIKNEIIEKMAELDGMKQAFEASCEQHLALSEQFRPSNIQTNLKVAILQAEEESENIVDDFLNRKMDVEDFTQKFIEKRKSKWANK
ncbi:hypothetical protein C0Q70_05578 [Pomacea canaliculata]|uniref:VPS37 C-terminal domain-containing protein n=1 Tax=Pomacea canaliculata TaxID=400727 RepID=A0A2T7PLP3_POMCA|nr:hypothetical protein C0Q70_05578 [Pomacea canaliculata]